MTDEQDAQDRRQERRRAHDDELAKSITRLEHAIFGIDDESGLLHEMRELRKGLVAFGADLDRRFTGWQFKFIAGLGALLLSLLAILAAILGK